MYERAIPGQRLRIPAGDWNAAMAAAEAHAASGKSGAGESRMRGLSEFGKLDQTVTAGVQASKTVSVWHGPAWGADDGPTGDTKPLDYVWDDMESGTYVEVWFHRGKWYAAPTECLP